MKDKFRKLGENQTKWVYLATLNGVVLLGGISFRKLYPTLHPKVVLISLFLLGIVGLIDALGILMSAAADIAYSRDKKKKAECKPGKRKK